MSQNKVWNWCKRLFCCGCCYDEDGCHLHRNTEPHYSKLTEKSLLARFPHYFFKRKYGKNSKNKVSNSLNQGLLQDYSNPWIEKCQRANELYEIDDDESNPEDQLL